MACNVIPDFDKFETHDSCLYAALIGLQHADYPLASQGVADFRYPETQILHLQIRLGHVYCFAD